VCIIAERKNVHHSIINSLDSHDSVELEAAICAASLFAAKSKYVGRIHTLFLCTILSAFGILMKWLGVAAVGNFTLAGTVWMLSADV